MGLLALCLQLGQGLAFADQTNFLLSLRQTNQWQFCAVTNDTGFANAAFLTFLPRTLPLDDTNAAVLTNFAPHEPDLDLYVSRDPALTNLDPAAIAAADKSVGRGGSETVAYSDAGPGVYYIGIKAESPLPAQFNFLAVFSDQPFAQADGQGNWSLRGFPVPAAIPAGSPDAPGTAYVLAIAPQPLMVRRVVVTNSLTHPAMGELLGTLTHGGVSVALNNYNSSNSASAGQTFVYDDSGEGDIGGAQPSDGPGSLQDFGGRPGFGQWLLTMASTNQPGSDDAFSLFLEQQPDLSSSTWALVQPGACREEFLTVPPGATNLMATIELNGGGGPLSAQLAPLGVTPAPDQPIQVCASASKGVLLLDKTSHPPVNPGLYVLRLCNAGPAAVNAPVRVSPGVDPNAAGRTVVTSFAPLSIVPGAVSNSSILVTNAGRLVSVEAGVRLEHPQVSALALRLVSPAGTSVVLSAYRGGDSTDGLGVDQTVTNLSRTYIYGGPDPQANTFDLGRTNGTIHLDCDFLSQPDEMTIYYEGNVIYDSGMVSGIHSLDVAFGPGDSSLVSIVMNPGGNPDPDTGWSYYVSSTRLDPGYLGFSDDPTRASLPIKFAPLPLTNITASGVFYKPEETMGKFAGETAAGEWRLEIWDSSAAAFVPAPKLVSWQLAFQLADPLPAPLTLKHGLARTNHLAAGDVQWFAVDAPYWACFATNTLLSASAPVSLWFDQNQVPTGSNADDLLLLDNTTAGSGTLQTNGLPPLLPGRRYFLGVQNTNAGPVTFVTEVDFDVTTLSQGGAVAGSLAASPAARYFAYDVSSNAVAVAFELSHLTGSATMVARAGLPLPDLNSPTCSSSAFGADNQSLVVPSLFNPLPLAPGRWYVGVFGSNSAPIDFSLAVTELTADNTNNPPLIGQTDNAGASQRQQAFMSLPGNVYYLLGKTNQDDTDWTVVSPTVTAADYQTSLRLPLPCPFTVFQVQQGWAPPLPPPVLSSLAWDANGARLSWQAPDYPAFRFQVQYAPSLDTPCWTTLQTSLIGTNGAYLFLDDGSQTGGLGDSRYYRLIQLP